MRISAVVNTWNEERNLKRCLTSLVPFVNEIVIVDMCSKDATVEIAREFTDKIYQHPQVGYVEPARNFAIEKATCEWILLLDADEVLPELLGNKLLGLANDRNNAYYRLPRKNFIFGKWIEHSGWWPDYKIRFFQKGMVTWDDAIHSIPITEGHGVDLPAEEEYTIIHYHYESIEQFVDRLNRYTTIEAISQKAKFSWVNLLIKPAGEFLSRFFLRNGYRDGIHGLALALLQAFSFIIVELKIWQQYRFPPKKIHLIELVKPTNKIIHDFRYWLNLKLTEDTKGIEKIWYKIKNIFLL